jgi:AcrR family transcriptional regulator
VRPVQKRAIQTVDLILQTAAQLLDEVGVDAFNTNLLADRAEVAVRSVYRYYPNKLAVIVALYERHEKAWAPHFHDAMCGLADPEQSALEVWERCVDNYVEYLDKDVGWAIRRVIQGIPEIRDIDRRDNDGRARKIAAALLERGARVNGRRLEAVGRLLIETTTAAIDDAWSRYGRVPTAVARELKLMHRSYLARYVD